MPSPDYKADLVRVLIIDDSPSMRGLITSILSKAADIEVVGAAADALQARAMIKALSPDVITLDIEMPHMSGIDFLEKVMRLRPMPVVMVSSLTRRGADASIEALSLGAVDCVGKPGLGDRADDMKTLPRVIRRAARAKVRPLIRQTSATVGESETRFGDKVILIGASTGGVEALGQMLRTLPKNCPPTLIVQHMPECYSASFATHLNKICPAEVALAEDREPLRAGRVVVAPGGARHLTLDTRAGLSCRLREGPKVNGHAPSVDTLFTSAVDVAARAVGVILTGIGRDGADGLAALRAGGARTIGQSKESCVVYGMPRAAREAGAVEIEAPLDRIAHTALGFCAEGAVGA